MARSFWRGTLSFGLVEIPVSLRPAVDEHDLSFTLLDRKDFSPVGYKRYNKKSGREVPWEQIVRGYEYEKDEYVVLTEEELARAHPDQTQTIEILEFIDGDELDPMFFDTPYFLEPQKKFSKGYVLLREALERTGRVGIGRLVLRTRQRLAAIVPKDKALTVILLRYSNELREPEVGTAEKANAVSKAEINMAERLIGDMTVKWKPDQFKDEYRDDVLALVKRKVKAGQTRQVVEEGEKRPRRARSEVMDLMPLLKQSLASRSKRPARAAAKRKGAGEERRRRSAS